VNRPSHASASLPEPTIRMSEGWHCLHLYYRVDQTALNALDTAAKSAGRDELVRILDPQRDSAPQRMQTSLVSGHTTSSAPTTLMHRMWW